MPHDTLVVNDTVKKDTAKTKRDTVLTPFAQAEMPPMLGIGEQYTWDRAAIGNTAALTLIQLLEQVPGLTVYASGWIPSPQFASYYGNPARLRIFVDGAELIALGNKTSYPLDLANVAIWNVQQMTVERGVDEVRVYIQTWNVTHTHTESRVDIVTGNLGTNLLRGFFGKRWENGFGVQFAGQVWGTQADASFANSTGSANDLMLRVGYAQGPWSVDGYVERGNGERDPQLGRIIDSPSSVVLSGIIPGAVGSKRIAYLRAGFGQADTSRWWAQMMLNSQQVTERNPPSTVAIFPESLTVIQNATQLIVGGGLNAGAFKLSASDRYRWLPAGGSDEFTARASIGGKFLSLSAFGDYVLDSGGILEGALTIAPTEWLKLEGAAGYRKADSAAGGNGPSARLTVGVKLGRVWFTGGVVQRDASVVPGLVAYDTLYTSAATAAATGAFFSANGKVVGDVGVNLWVIRWQAPGWYRPQLQERGEVYLDTQWLSQFPSGNFGLHAAFGSEYRSDVMFPTAGIPETFDSPTPPAVAFHSVTLYFNLQVRVLTATLYFNSIFALSPSPYELVPQYLMPVQIYTYGLRWSFWN